MLTARQRRAIEALMIQPTVDAAAKAAGVSRVTLWRWLRDATFCNELKRAGDAAIAATTRRLATLSGSAVNTLALAMRDGETTGVKVRAADIVLSRLLSLKEQVELEQRVAALEERTR